MDLDNAPFNALRQATSGLSAPPGVEKELLAAFAKLHAKPRWYQRLSPLQWGLAGGAGGVTAMLAVFLLALQLSPPGPAGQGALSESSAAFVALDSLERIQQEPSPRMVQAEFSRAELATMGVPTSPETAGDTVRAEMLIGSDGQALALRLL